MNRLKGLAACVLGGRSEHEQRPAMHWKAKSCTASGEVERGHRLGTGAASTMRSPACTEAVMTVPFRRVINARADWRALGAWIAFLLSTESSMIG